MARGRMDVYRPTSVTPRRQRNEQQYETNAQFAPLTNAPANAPRNIYDTGTFAINNDGMPPAALQPQLRGSRRRAGRPDDLWRGLQQNPARDGRADLRPPRRRLQFDRWWMSDVIVGVNYADREKDKYQPEGGLNTINGGYFQIAPEHLEAPTNLVVRGRRPGARMGRPAVLGAYYQPIVYGSPTTPGFDYLIGKNWNVTRKSRRRSEGQSRSRAVVDRHAKRQHRRAVRQHRPESRMPSIHADSPGRNRRRRAVRGRQELRRRAAAINLAFMLPTDQAVRVGIAGRSHVLAWISSRRRTRSATTPRPAYLAVPAASRCSIRGARMRSICRTRSISARCVPVGSGFYKDLKTYIYNQTDSTHDFSDLLADLPPGYLPGDDIVAGDRPATSRVRSTARAATSRVSSCRPRSPAT